jgi:alcohol dehydrogenase (cytochrome c)
MRFIVLSAVMSAALPMMALAQTADELSNDEKTPGDILTYGMGYSLLRQAA